MLSRRCERSSNQTLTVPTNLPRRVGWYFYIFNIKNLKRLTELKTMNSQNKEQYSTETKLEIFGTLCQYFSVNEILKQFPKIGLSESSGYAFLSRNYLPTFKRSFVDRKKEAEIIFKEKEEQLKLNALSDLQESLANQGIEY